MANPINRACLQVALRSTRGARCSKETVHHNVHLNARNSLTKFPNHLTTTSSPVNPRHARTFTSSTNVRARERRRQVGDEFESSDKKLVQDGGFDGDIRESDLGSAAYVELEQHREMREMVRLAAWDMPLLSRFAMRWRASTETLPALRWRYTTYLGEAHPASQKVVVEFRVDRLPNLDKKQQLKFAKLAGPRYNPDTHAVKMSCESFETQAQNKRYLSDTIHKLLTEARNPETDDFTDVPLDTRHHKPKRRIKFPVEWSITPERRGQLDQMLLAEGEIEKREKEEDELVIGAAVITAAAQTKPQPLPVPVMQRARRTAK